MSLRSRNFAPQCPVPKCLVSTCPPTPVLSVALIRLIITTTISWENINILCIIFCTVQFTSHATHSDFYAIVSSPSEGIIQAGKHCEKQSVCNVN